MTRGNKKPERFVRRKSNMPGDVEILHMLKLFFNLLKSPEANDYPSELMKSGEIEPSQYRIQRNFKLSRAVGMMGLNGQFYQGVMGMVFSFSPILTKVDAEKF